MSASYEKRQAEWIEKNEIEKGNKVRIVRKAKTKENGWGAVWVEEMDAYVGEEGEVLRISRDYGLRVRFGTDEWSLPYFVLEKVEPKEKEMKKSYEERQAEWVKKHDVKVGDRVRLIRAASNEEDGWPSFWPRSADGWIGNILRVRSIGALSIMCYNHDADDWFGFPYFVLEKVVERKDKEWEVSYGLKVKTGDPVLMRSENDSQWTYSLFSYIHINKKVPYPYYGCGVISSVCIPYKGNEHLAGTTDAYVSEKKEPPKFFFGTKVKAKLSNGEEMEGVLTGYDNFDDDAPFEVIVRDKKDLFGRVRYWAKEITYID